MSVSRFFSASFLLISMTACFGGDLEPGYSECDDAICSPGQYCDAIGFCQNGCVSDDNCLPSDECVITDDFFNEGECYPRESSTDTGSPSTGTPLEDCQAACDDFQVCGLGAGEAAQCRSDCAGLNESQQIAIGNCRDMSCDAALTCLGVDCFTDDDCGGAQCLDYTCI